MTPRTEAGRLFVADDPAALPGVVAVEAEQDAATRKELAAKVAALRHRIVQADIYLANGEPVKAHDELAAALSGEPKPKERTL